MTLLKFAYCVDCSRNIWMECCLNSNPVIQNAHFYAKIGWSRWVSFSCIHNNPVKSPTQPTESNAIFPILFYSKLQLQHKWHNITSLHKTVLSSLPFEGLPNACINESYRPTNQANQKEWDRFTCFINNFSNNRHGDVRQLQEKAEVIPPAIH